MNTIQLIQAQIPRAKKLPRSRYWQARAAMTFALQPTAELLGCHKQFFVFALQSGDIVLVDVEAERACMPRRHWLSIVEFMRE
jgi:hypothetical protein